MTFTRIGQTGQMLAEKNPCVDGSKLGGTGVEIRPHGSSEIATWLSAQTPEDMDKAAVSRALSHGVNLEVRYEGRYPTGQNGESLPSYTVATACEIAGNDEQRAAAKADLLNFMTPAPIDKIERWLAELSVLTAGRGVDGISAELLVTAYSSRLAKFPADVVRYALLERSWTWFPAWEELEKVCKAKASPRQHMINALSQPQKQPEPKRRPPTQEERDRIDALIAEKFPEASLAWQARAAEEVTKGNCIRVGEAAE